MSPEPAGAAHRGGVWATVARRGAANVAFDLGFTAVVSSTPTSLPLVAGETGVATFAVVVALAVVLLKRASVWQVAGRDPGPAQGRVRVGAGGVPDVGHGASPTRCSS